jgi:hypothetical protein
MVQQHALSFRKLLLMVFAVIYAFLVIFVQGGTVPEHLCQQQHLL